MRLLVIILLLILSSCNRGDGERLIFDLTDAISGNKITNFEVMSRRLVYSKGWIKGYEYDTFNIVNRNYILKDDIYKDKNCISNIYIKADNYYSFWHYRFMCDEPDGLDTLSYVLKPHVKLDLNVKLTPEVGDVWVRTKTMDKENTSYIWHDVIIGRMKVNNDSNTTFDTTIHLPVVQQDSIFIKYGKDNYHPETLLVTDSSYHYSLDIEF